MPPHNPTPKERWISKLRKSKNNELPLTALDYHAPQIYTRLVYGFHFDNSKQDEAKRDLLRSLKIAFTHWPFLAGQVYHPHPQDGKPISLWYSTSSDLWNINQNFLEHEVFCYQDLTYQSNPPNPNSDKFPRSFKELLGQNGDAQPAVLNKDILSLSSQHPDGTNMVPPGHS